MKRLVEPLPAADNGLFAADQLQLQTLLRRNQQYRDVSIPQVFLQVSVLVQVDQVDLRYGQSYGVEVPAEGNESLIFFPVHIDGPNGPTAGACYPVVFPWGSGSWKFGNGKNTLPAPPVEQVIQQL